MQNNREVFCLNLNFEETLEKTQEYISGIFSADTTPDRESIANHIRHFLLTNQMATEETVENLCNRLLDEMQGFSVLTPLLEREDVEEINVNGWDDIKVTYTNGHTEQSLPAGDQAVAEILPLSEQSGGGGP